MRIFKVILFLGVMGFVALAGYAYLGDIAPEKTQVSHPVPLDGK